MWFIGKMHADGTGGGNTILGGTGARIGVCLFLSGLENIMIFSKISKYRKYHDIFYIFYIFDIFYIFQKMEISNKL